MRVTASFAVEPDTAYLLAVELRGEGFRGGRVFVVWADEYGDGSEDLGYLLQNAEPGRGRQKLVQVGISPAAARTAYVAVALRDGATSLWTMHDLRFRRLGSPVLAVLYAQATFMGQRMGSLAGFADPTGQNLEGISERFGETQFLLEQVRDAGPAQKLFGAGLGARYTRKLRDGQDAHYIHNFYAFLLYKTGIVGTVLVLAAMSLWIGFTFVAARRSRDPWRRAFLWAVFSAWIGYAVWSLACPEILNFRMAPLWGFVIAVTGQTDREERETSPCGDKRRARWSAVEGVALQVRRTVRRASPPGCMAPIEEVRDCSDGPDRPRGAGAAPVPEPEHAAFSGGERRGKILARALCSSRTTSAPASRSSRYWRSASRTSGPR